jgi:hypothetical protein
MYSGQEYVIPVLKTSLKNYPLFVSDLHILIFGPIILFRLPLFHCCVHLKVMHTYVDCPQLRVSTAVNPPPPPIAVYSIPPVVYTYIYLPTPTDMFSVLLLNNHFHCCVNPRGYIRRELAQHDFCLGWLEQI